MTEPFDASYYEELQGRVRGLLIRVGDWLEQDEASLIDSFIDANEIELALTTICDLLAELDATLSHDAVDEMERLAERMQLTDPVRSITALRKSAG